MSSFTAHILFNLPTVLPIGKERIHRMSGKWVDESSTTNSRLDCPVAASSVERVYIAVKSGLRSSENVNSRVSEAEKTVPVTIRMTESQRMVFRALGSGKWLRNKIAEAQAHG